MTFPVNSPFLLFQSALPRGERLEQLRSWNGNHKISIRAPARGATRTKVILICPVQFQSALPRGERHHVIAIMTVLGEISIRAPARGATCRSRHGIQKYTISIRAPARGATGRAAPGRYKKGFQSALPRGERHYDSSSFFTHF